MGRAQRIEEIKNGKEVLHTQLNAFCLPDHGTTVLAEKGAAMAILDLTWSGNYIIVRDMQGDELFRCDSWAPTMAFLTRMENDARYFTQQ